MKNRPRPVPSWQAIASFYAGRPVTIGVDDRGPLQAGTGAAESGNIFLGSGIQRNLADFLKQWRLAKTDKQRAGLAALGMNGLPVLLHEAMHNHHFDTSGGMPDAWDENQARALGSELIPDLMQRFFGVPIDSPVGRAFLKAARARSEYQQVYNNPYQPPPVRPGL